MLVYWYTGLSSVCYLENIRVRMLSNKIVFQKFCQEHGLFERLYCACVEFTKAFDFVVRDMLCYKLIKLGVRGKMLNIIKSIYILSNRELNIKHTQRGLHVQCRSKPRCRNHFKQRTLGIDGLLLYPLASVKSNN